MCQEFGRCFEALGNQHAYGYFACWVRKLEHLEDVVQWCRSTFFWLLQHKYTYCLDKILLDPARKLGNRCRLRISCSTEY
eukprot:UN17220